MNNNMLQYFPILAIIGAFAYLITTNEGSIKKTNEQQINSDSVTLETFDKNVSREFNFQYTVLLEKSDEKVEVWIPIPQSNAVQKISNVEIFSSSPINCTQLEEEEHGNLYYYCASSRLKSPTLLALSADVVRYEHQSVNYDGVNPDNYDLGTNNQTVFEGAVFNQIIEEANLSKDNVKDIYEYVLSGMHYGKPKSLNEDDQYYAGKNPKTDKDWLPDSQKYGRMKVSKEEVVGAYIKSKNDKTKADYTFGNGNSQYACDIGVGNCTDYHSYFMSLCRTLDIPARFHMGFSIPKKEGENEGKVGGYHCWADYYTEGKGWSPVDISEADKDPSKSDYFFGTVNENRVEFTVGRDFKLKNNNSIVNFFVYPIVKGTDYTKSFYYKNL